MDEIRIDNSVLQDEADKFLEAAEVYRKTLMKDAAAFLSEEFAKRAQVTDGLLHSVLDPLLPVEGAPIIEILNAQNAAMLSNVRCKKGFFENDPQGRKRRHFLSLVDKTYVHGPKKMFDGGRGEKEAAKRILRECAEATILYHVMVRKRNHGAVHDPAMVREIVHKAHELISENPDCVVPFPMGRRRSPGPK